MLDRTEITTKITMYVVIFSDISTRYTSLKIKTHIVISIIILIWSNITKFCSNFNYNVFSEYSIVLYREIPYWSFRLDGICKINIAPQFRLECVVRKRQDTNVIGAIDEPWLTTKALRAINVLKAGRLKLDD